MEEFAVVNHILKKMDIKEFEFTPLQKEVILKEINFRIKNNLNTIASLFGLQILNAKDVENHAISKVLQTNKVRINTFSILHEIMYDKDGKKIALDTYIQKIIDLINSETKLFAPVAIKIDDNVSLTWEKMIKLGTIIGELYTNTLQYAFVGGSEKGLVKISLSKEKEKYIFVYHEYNDLSKPIDVEKLFISNTIGGKLIKINVTQLQGELMIKNDNGLMFSILFS